MKLLDTNIAVYDDCEPFLHVGECDSSTQVILKPV